MPIASYHRSLLRNSFGSFEIEKIELLVSFDIWRVMICPDCLIDGAHC